MNCVLCIDNSGSTSGCQRYWDKVLKIYQELKPTRLIYWNSDATEKEKFVQYSTGGTQPNSFIGFIKNEKSLYNLIITTDGEISDSDIDRCGRQCTPELFSLINSTTIYYIGTESHMNIGLNVIFGRSKHMSYFINENRFEHLSDKFDELNLEEFMSPNFSISLIVKIKNIQLSSCTNEVREIKLAELRGQVSKLFSKLEHDSLKSSSDEKLKTYYENNQMKEFIDLLTQDRLDVQAVSQKKSAMLNLFDHKIDFNISRINAASKIQEQEIEVPAEEDGAWSEFEDVITLDNFNLPCVLVQNTDIPLITDKIILKNPFNLLSQPEIIKKILQLIEPNPIDYTTYQKLAFNGKGYTISPYTRVECKGVFVFDAINMKCVKNNCRVISVLFGNQNKVPSNLVIWNLVVMYLLYKYKFTDTQYTNVIFDELISYCKRFSVGLSFTHQCQILRPAKIEICLWYCVQAVPRICPNNAKNVLRSPFGLELLEFYLETFGRTQDEYLTELVHRTKKWAVWNYLLANKTRSGLKLEVAAQYQNYSIHKDKIILLTGKCDSPFKSKCNILDADSVNTLFVNVTNTSAKYENLDGFTVVPARADCTESKSNGEQLTHVKINIQTCWPYVICPITKLHWRECAGTYDIKSGSLVRLFNLFCIKYKTYPETYMDLALLYSRRIENVVLSKTLLDNLKTVHLLFKDVMTTYSCEEYITIYTTHTDENLRLSKE